MATSYKKLLISTEEIRNFRRYLFITEYSKKVLLFLYKLRVLDRHPKYKTSYDILSFYGVDFGKYFSSIEIIKLKGNPDDLDISLIRKIFKCLWVNGIQVDGTYILNDSLASSVEGICDERNSVSHEQGSISLAELTNHVRNFQSKLESTLDEAKNPLHHDHEQIEQLKNKIQNAVPALLEKIHEEYDTSNTKDVEKLNNEIVNYWDQQYEYIQHLTQMELNVFYERLCKNLPDDMLAQFGLTDPDSIMVPLKIYQEKESHGCIQNHECKIFDQNEILEVKDAKGENPKAIIVSGDYASGKTTMLRRTLEKCYKDPGDMVGLSSFQTVFYMQFRNQSYDNFDDYLQSLLPQVVSRFGLQHIKSSIFRSKCLILCDGYHKANDKSKNLLDDILCQKFNDVKVVITTRPGNVERLTEVVEKARCSRINLRILGLRMGDQRSLIKKTTLHLMKDKPVTETEAMHRLLLHALDEMNEEERRILKTPTYLNLFILLCIESPDARERINSVTTLHIELSKHRKKKIIKDTGIKAESFEEFDMLYRDKSFKNLENWKYELSELDIANMKADIENQEVVEKLEPILSYYFNIKHNIEGVEINRVFCYRHPSELKFAAAWRICDELVSHPGEITFSEGFEGTNFGFRVIPRCEIKRDCKPSFNVRAMCDERVLIFVVGILYNCYKNTLHDHIDSFHKIFFNSTCIYTIGRTVELLMETISNPSPMEYRFDPKVLESLVSAIKDSEEDEFMIRHIRFLSAVPPVLTKLVPKRLHIDFHHYFTPGSYFFQRLSEAISAARHLGIPVMVSLLIEMDDLHKFSGFPLQEVDILNVQIEDDGNDNLELEKLNQNTFGRFPLSGFRQRLTYFGKRKDVHEVADIINGVWPSSRECDITETEARGIPSSNEKQKAASLEIGFDEGKTEGEMMTLFERLTIQPLTELITQEFSSCPKRNQELQETCIKMGLGVLGQGLLGDLIPNHIKCRGWQERRIIRAIERLTEMEI